MRETVRRWVYERPMAVAVVVVALHLLVATLAWDPIPHGGGDNTAYLALARSLLDGRYLELWDPARPPHSQYPPVFPAILAAAWTVGIRSWAALKLMMVAISGMAAGLSYLWLRHRVRPRSALVLAGLLAVAPGLALDSQWVLSDVPFWVATLAALVALERGRTISGIVLAFLALGIRTAGLPLLLAIGVWSALRREWRQVGGVVLGLVVMAVPWMLRGGSVNAPYLSQLWLADPYRPELGTIGLTGLADRVMGNGSEYGLRILAETLTGFTGWVAAVVGVATLALAAAGFGRRLAGVDAARSGAGRTRYLTEVFAAFYTGMILLWPEPWAAARFLLPLLPIILAYAAEGTLLLPGRARGGVRWAASLVVLGLTVPSSLVLWQAAAGCRAEARIRGVVACGSDAHRAFIALAEWSRDRLPEGAAVISRKPRQWYWYSGYPGRVYPFFSDGDRLLEEARTAGARYVVVDELGGASRLYLLPAIQANQDRYCVVQRIRRGGASASMLGILPPGSAGLDPGAEAIAGRLRFPICPPAFRQPAP